MMYIRATVQKAGPGYVGSRKQIGKRWDSTRYSAYLGARLSEAQRTREAGFICKNPFVQRDPYAVHILVSTERYREKWLFK